MTSHDVVQRVRRACRTRKVGHAGTLDPLATGVLPVAVGAGTKILQFLLAEDKSYRATFKLGIATDTFDSQGKVLSERPIPPLTLSLLDEVCGEFRGSIEQLPPMFSALKQDGVPLYKLARQGKTVERLPRQVTVSRLEVIQYEADEVVVEIDCSKGTYVRSLVSEIGEKLGCGACLTALRRLRSGDFDLSECCHLEDLQPHDRVKDLLLSLDSALRAYPAITLDAAAADLLRYGIPPAQQQTLNEDRPDNGAVVRLLIDNDLAAIARYCPAREKEKRGDFELLRVFVSH